MSLIEDFRYRPDIDGLRAVAVISVVLYHADLLCPGGFVGVDVFFVISGFLITSLIWKDLETGKFTFTNFWERRARRIIPPLVVMILATFVAGWFLLLPDDFINLGRAAAAQAVFSANIHYWLDTGYFSGIAKEKPLLHTWSLAVEEQFYLIVPFVLWAAFRFKFFKRRAGVLSLLGAGFAASLAISIYGVANFPASTFYLLHTRAWELLTGSIVAFIPALSVRRGTREFVSLAGILLIITPVFGYTSATPFPGLAALPPCVGTALIIWSNNKQTIAGSLLSMRPVVYVGLISYSLYLYHWVFFAYSKYMQLVPFSLSFGWRAGMVGLSFLCAFLSFKYIETPFRTRKAASSRKEVFAFAGSGLVIVLFCGLAGIWFQGFPQRLSPQKLEFANAVTDKEFINEHTIDDILSDRLAVIGVPDIAAPPKVLVWGDSHAMAAMPAFDIVLKEKGLTGRAVTHNSTAPVINWYYPYPTPGLNKDSIPFNNAVISYINKHSISDVVLCAMWSPFLEVDGFRYSLLKTVELINSSGARVWIMLDVPTPSFEVPRALARFDYSEDYLQTLFARRNEFAESDLILLKSAGAQILDPVPYFKDSKGRYVIQSQGIALYRDGHHLTGKGAKLILVPFLRNSFLTTTNETK